jgi:hypothetical protein
MNLAATLETLDDDLRDWRVRGMNGSPEERAKFLKSCFHGARVTLRTALLATSILRPGRTPREVFDEFAPRLIEKVAEEGREAGYTDEQVRSYVEAHDRACRALAGEFGFVAMTDDEIESLKDFSTHFGIDGPYE